MVRFQAAGRPVHSPLLIPPLPTAPYPTPEKLALWSFGEKRATGTPETEELRAEPKASH